jgi:hypothetical protein
MTKLILVALGCVGVSLCAMPACAADPVALVEDVGGAPAGVEAMSYVTAGSVIRLGGAGRLVLDYLGSCVRETIKGGVVTVGTDASKVAGGTVGRETVQCDGGQLNLSTRQAAQSGVVVFRMPPQRQANQAAPVTVDRTLYGLCPLIDLPGGGTLVIERLDQPGEKLTVDIPAAQLTRGSFYDFAKTDRSLAAGGVYRATAGGRSIVFKVDPFAQPGQSPLAGRLLRL